MMADWLTYRFRIYLHARKATGKRRWQIPTIIQDVCLAFLAAVSFTIGALLMIELIRRYGLCVW